MVIHLCIRRLYKTIPLLRKLFMIMWPTTGISRPAGEPFASCTKAKIRTSTGSSRSLLAPQTLWLQDVLWAVAAQELKAPTGGPGPQKVICRGCSQAVAPLSSITYLVRIQCSAATPRSGTLFGDSWPWSAQVNRPPTTMPKTRKAMRTHVPCHRNLPPLILRNPNSAIGRMTVHQP